MTCSEAAAELRVCPRTVRRMLERGELRAVRVGPRLVRIRRADLQAMIGDRSA